MKSISVTKSFNDLGSALMASIRKRFTATFRPLRRPRNTSLVPLHPIKVADISTDERFKQCCLIRAAAFGVELMRLPAICSNALDWMSLGRPLQLPETNRATSVSYLDMWACDSFCQPSKIGGVQHIYGIIIIIWL